MIFFKNENIIIDKSKKIIDYLNLLIQLEDINIQNISLDNDKEKKQYNIKQEKITNILCKSFGYKNFFDFIKKNDDFINNPMTTFLNSEISIQSIINDQDKKGESGVRFYSNFNDLHNHPYQYNYLFSKLLDNFDNYFKNEIKLNEKSALIISYLITDYLFYENDILNKYQSDYISAYNIMKLYDFKFNFFYDIILEIKKSNYFLNFYENKPIFRLKIKLFIVNYIDIYIEKSFLKSILFKKGISFKNIKDININLISKCNYIPDHNDIFYLKYYKLINDYINFIYNIEHKNKFNFNNIINNIFSLNNLIQLINTYDKNSTSKLTYNLQGIPHIKILNNSINPVKTNNASLKHYNYIIFSGYLSTFIEHIKLFCINKNFRHFSIFINDEASIKKFLESKDNLKYLEFFFKKINKNIDSWTRLDYLDMFINLPLFYINKDIYNKKEIKIYDTFTGFDF